MYKYSHEYFVRLLSKYIDEPPEKVETALEILGFRMTNIENYIDPKGVYRKDIVDTSPLPDKVLEIKQLSGDMKNALEGFSAREREILEKRYWEEKTFPDIGSDLNVSKQRIFKIHGDILHKLRTESPYREILEPHL